MEAFPTEVLQHIFTFLPVRDIVLLRRVCSSFQRVIQDRHVWSTVYKYCSLPRLPGPFPGQTAHYLEISLTQSAKLQRIWASPLQGIVKPLHTRTLHLPFSNEIIGNLLIGPWLVVAVSKQIVCYDLDSGNSDGSIIYDASRTIIYAFSATGALYSREQHRAYLVVQENMGDSQRVVKIFQLLVSDHKSGNTPTLELLSERPVTSRHQFVTAVGPRYFAVAPMYLEDSHTNVYVMDTKCHRLLYIPDIFESTQSVNQPTLPSGAAFSTLLVCSSHILVARTVPQRIHHCSSFVNAFQLPSDEDMEHRTSTLDMTHSGVFPDVGFMDVTCLRDSVVDATGSTLLTLIGHARAPTYQTSQTLDIVRLELTTDGRILMSECRTLLELDFGFTIHLQCFQGCGRGLLEGFMYSKRRLAISVNDSDNDSPVIISNIKTSPRAQILEFDGIGGRICQWSRDSGMDLEVVYFV